MILLLWFLKTLVSRLFVMRSASVIKLNPSTEIKVDTAHTLFLTFWTWSLAIHLVNLAIRLIDNVHLALVLLL